MPGLPILTAFFDIPHQGKPERVQYSYSNTASRNHYSFFYLALGEMAMQLTLAIAYWDVEYTCDEET